MDENGLSPLLLGLKEGSTRTVDYVIRNGCDVNVVDKDGHSALFEATFSPYISSLDPAKALLDHGK